MQTPSFPPEITLEFHDSGRYIKARELEKFLKQDIIPVIRDHLKLVNDKSRDPTVIRFLQVVNRFLKRIDRFSNYLNSWSEHMSFQQYIERRRTNYTQETNDLRGRFREFEISRQSEEKHNQARVREGIQQIERREILNIFEDDVLESI
jgi:hypothetical protein